MFHEHLGVTIVYVTHDQAEALTMSDRIAVFHRGVVQQLDTPTALYEASVVQWEWLDSYCAHCDQFNGIHYVSLVGFLFKSNNISYATAFLYIGIGVVVIGLLVLLANIRSARKKVFVVAEPMLQRA